MNLQKDDNNIVVSPHKFYQQLSINQTEQLDNQNQLTQKKKILDGRYQILQEIGDGRFAKVMKAIDLNQQKEVAVKIMKTKQRDFSSKKTILQNFFKEIEILSKCENKNIVKLTDASFNGTMITEQFNVRKASVDFNKIDEIRQEGDERENDTETQQIISKRKNNICYCILKLARHGELYQILEYSEKFSDNLSRFLFKQLIDGLEYLHNAQIVHRDIKPENLLVDIKGRLIIGDFGYSCDNLFDKEQIKSYHCLHKQGNVGSEEYNAPELFDLSVDSYDGAKADIFSMGVTLFLMQTKCPPFRSAQIKDPYYRRLCASDKTNFWKIFESFQLDKSFKDLFERMTDKDPNQRISISLIKQHEWYNEIMDTSDLVNELDMKGRSTQKIVIAQYKEKCEKMKQYWEVEEQIIRNEEDLEEFEKIRNYLINELEDIKMKIKFNKSKRKLDLQEEEKGLGYRRNSVQKIGNIEKESEIKQQSENLFNQNLYEQHK